MWIRVDVVQLGPLMDELVVGMEDLKMMGIIKIKRLMLSTKNVCRRNSQKMGTRCLSYDNGGKVWIWVNATR